MIVNSRGVHSYTPIFFCLSSECTLPLILFFGLLMIDSMLQNQKNILGKMYTTTHPLYIKYYCFYYC